MPVVGGKRDDWERRCVLEGAEWVYEAVRECWGVIMGENLMEEENDDGVGLEAGDRRNSRRGYEVHGYAEEMDRDGEDRATEDVRNNGAEHRTPQDEVESERGLGTEGSGRAPGTIEFDELDDDDEIEPDEGEDESKEMERDGAEAQVVICLLRLLRRWTEMQIEKAVKEA
ncbi:hypothetical protein BU25DRAFT_448907 [Macroventuria anomochaeta]|uniref:Uncharacterized protein n=1 Tax=Macroventuria anomochaeta TaxID=301207 RepID=A0ACB6RZG5_9PLEO|nr:uncharacterized protein BU25DRAFT_448907 [Macroventuria anomochaeta]KAF2627168.1 hypothetical protein BU25DRAFT_448907 [Macroventuria anomochaeta]